MGRSQRLRLSDVREVFRVVGEVRELGHDPECWPKHMGTRLGHLVRAKAAFTGEGYAVGPDLAYNGFVSVGLTDSADSRGFGRFASSPAAMGSRFMRVFARNYYRRFLAARPDVFEDTDWYGSDHFHEWRVACGLDEWLHSQFHLNQTGGIHMICLNRPPGDVRFSLRERKLLKLFHDELQRLWHEPPPVSMNDPIGRLAPRLRLTLERLLEGDSEKQAALKLGLSYHSVHQYVKELHRQFGVRSRGELLAKARQRAYDFRPKLAGPPMGWRRIPKPSVAERSEPRQRELAMI